MRMLLGLAQFVMAPCRMHENTLPRPEVDVPLALVEAARSARRITVLTGAGSALPATIDQDAVWDGYFARHYEGVRAARRIFAGAGVVFRWDDTKTDPKQTRLNTGPFGTIGGGTHHSLARLNADGSIGR